MVSCNRRLTGLKAGKTVGSRSAVALRASRALGEGTVASADIVRTFRDAVSAFTMRSASRVASNGFVSSCGRRATAPHTLPAYSRLSGFQTSSYVSVWPTSALYFAICFPAIMITAFAGTMSINQWRHVFGLAPSAIGCIHDGSHPTSALLSLQRVSSSCRAMKTVKKYSLQVRCQCKGREKRGVSQSAVARVRVHEKSYRTCQLAAGRKSIACIICRLRCTQKSSASISICALSNNRCILIDLSVLSFSGVNRWSSLSNGPWMSRRNTVGKAST